MSVKLFFWNVCGLNDPVKHRTLCSWLNSHKPLFGALLETHIKELSLAPIMSTLCQGWNYTSNHSCDEDGRIILIWRDPLKLRVIGQSAQAITCELLIPGQPSFIYTAIYASNLSDERNDLWVELMQLHASLSLEDSPWMIGGDFNQVLFGSEHVTASENINYAQMYQFVTASIRWESVISDIQART